MKYLLHILISISVLGLVSCESYLDYDLPEEEKKLVVNALFNTDSVWTVHVSRSMGVVGWNPFKTYDNAVVKLYEDNKLVEQFAHIKDGQYISAAGLKPKQNKTYELRVSHPEHDAVSSANQLPLPIIIQKVDTSSSTNEWGGRNLNLSITFNDPKNEKNYYGIIAGYQETYVISEFYVIDSMIYEYRDTFSTSYDFYPEIEENTFANNNMMFTHHGLVFSDDFFNGSTYQIDFSSSNPGEGFDPGWGGNIEYLERKIWVQLNHLSQEYYWYSTSLTRQEWTQGDPFSQPVQVFGNITNGYGIFAGYASNRMEVDLN